MKEDSTHSMETGASIRRPLHETLDSKLDKKSVRLNPRALNKSLNRQRYDNDRNMIFIFHILILRHRKAHSIYS